MPIPAVPPAALPLLRQTERDHGRFAAFGLRHQIAAAVRHGPPTADRAACEASVRAAERVLLGAHRPAIW